MYFFRFQYMNFSQSLNIFEEKKHRKSRFFTAGRLLCGFLGCLQAATARTAHVLPHRHPALRKRRAVLSEDAVQTAPLDGGEYVTSGQVRAVAG